MISIHVNIRILGSLTTAVQVRQSHTTEPNVEEHKDSQEFLPEVGCTKGELVIFSKSYIKLEIPNS